MTADILCRLVNLVFIAFATRHLGLADFGIYMTVITFLGFTQVFTSLGLQKVIVRDVAQDKTRGGAYFSNSLMVMLSVSLVGWGGMVMIAWLLRYPPAFRGLLILAGASLLFDAARVPAVGILRAHEKMGVFAALNIGLSLAASLSGIVLLKLGFGLESLIVLLVGSSAVTSLAYFVVVHRNYAKFSARFDGTLARMLAGDGFLLFLIGALLMVQYKIDILMLSKMKGAEEVAVYAAAVRIINALLVFQSGTAGALFPFLSSRWTSSRESMSRIYQEIIRFYVLASFGVSVWITIVSGRLLAWLFGSAYADGSLPLILLVWAFFFQTLGGPLAMLIIIAKDKLLKYLPFALGGALLNVMLNLWFIPRYGYTGAAFTTLLTEIFSFIVKFALALYLFKERPRLFSLCWRSGLAAIGMGGVMILIRDFHLWVLMIVGAGLYLFNLYVLGELKRQRIQTFRQAWGEIQRSSGGRGS